ncbi:MAG: hypothetical protein J5J06_20360, partial [Phycisphaerae bacterium]|nr:hypothetical protein [Phycisphaerae bacterium]
MMPDPCNPPLRGACCFPDACISGTTAAGCADASGSYQGDGSNCGGVTCGECGDNVVQSVLGEECDGIDNSACACSSCYPPGHSNECTCAPPPVCGNNIVEECEQCDGTDDSACPGECDAMTCTCPLPVFAIKWHSVHGGGVVSVGATMKLLGAIGQADAGVATGGTYELSGGFLGGALSAPLPATPTAVPTYPHGAVKQRYVSFAPDAGHTNVGYRVKDVGSGSQYYISTPRTTPASVVGQGLTFVVSDASPILNDWTSLTRIHVGGCMIAPGDNAASSTGRAYEVTATNDGASFSPPLTVFTAARPTAANARFWADVVGLFSAGGDGSTTPPTPANSWTPPNRNVSGFDISATLQAVSAAPTAPHFTWV